MTEESTPNADRLHSEAEDPSVILAHASLVEAQAKLAKASTPLLDKLILRGIIPIALAVVGPWALWKFDKAQTEQEKQGETITALQDLLKTSQEDQADRQARSVVWQARMKVLEEEKAVELIAMTSMVSRLDDMLKTALVQMALARVMGPTAGAPMGTQPLPVAAPNRASILADVAAQVQLPGLAPEEVERIAGQQYDRLHERRK